MPSLGLFAFTFGRTPVRTVHETINLSLFVTLVFNFSHHNNYINRIVLKESSTAFICIFVCSSYVFAPKMIIWHLCLTIMYISKFHLSRQTTICFHIKIIYLQ